MRRSTRKHKKYMVRTPSGRLVHFGDSRHPQYFDATNLKLFTRLNHRDRKRRKLFLVRMTGKSTKAEALRIAKPYSAKWYSIKYLW